VTLAWREDGPQEAPALVLLNSIGTTTEMWTPCLGALSEQLHVVRIDTRGHGASAPSPPGMPCTVGDLGQDVLAVLDELRLGRVHLAGVSLGAMTAMWLAIHHPARVARLAVLCTAAHLATGRTYLDRAAAVRNGGMAAIADVPARVWITESLVERDPAMLAELQAMLAGVDAESYAQCCEALAEVDLRADLGRIAAPTLVAAGTDDPATPPEYAQAIAAAVPDARLVVLGQAAHLAPVEQPARVAQLLLGHFGGGATLAAGYATRRTVLGDEYVDRAVAATTEFTAPFQEFLNRYAWGDVWSRPGLAPRERSIATLAALVTLGGENEIAVHVHAARRNGLSADEIAEVLLHTALYAGLPRANRAFAIARDVLGDST
jgi:3-oxoadipate enol-lactonase / 4-carboxymuconolactone decarboxylase